MFDLAAGERLRAHSGVHAAQHGVAAAQLVGRLGEEHGRGQAAHLLAAHQRQHAAHLARVARIRRRGDGSEGLEPRETDQTEQRYGSNGTERLIRQGRDTDQTEQRY